MQMQFIISKRRNASLQLTIRGRREWRRWPTTLLSATLSEKLPWPQSCPRDVADAERRGLPSVEQVVLGGLGGGLHVPPAAAVVLLLRRWRRHLDLRGGLVVLHY
jgi:hypothetical protein